MANEHVVKRMYLKLNSPSFPVFKLGLALTGALLLVINSGCSVRRIAVNKLGDALSHSGTSFASDDDPELVKSAVPFSLKLIESLLSETPKHTGLLLAAASGFTQYSYAFVQEEADELEDKNLTRATELRLRARKLYARARKYGLRGLEVKYPGFEQALRKDPKAAVQAVKTRDVDFLYWTAAAWAAEISLSKDQPDTVVELPFAEALIDRALELDESFDSGAVHAFLISYELARPGARPDAETLARKHFARAMELSQGLQAGPLVSLAEGVSVKNQNVKEFKSLLEQALAIKVDAKPEWRLVNLVMQQRARWLLSRTDDLFLAAEPAPEKAK